MEDNHTSPDDPVGLLRIVADMTEERDVRMFVFPELLRWAADEIEELRLLAEADANEIDHLTTLLSDRNSRD